MARSAPAELDLTADRPPSRAGRIASRLTPGSTVVLVAALGLLAVAILGPPLLGAEASRVDVPAAREGSSAEHWLGTDDLGRDVLARTVVAARLSVELSLIATLLGAAVGFSVGGLAGVVGPRGRRALGRVIGVGVAFPAILVALFVAAIMGPGARSAVVAVAIALTPIFARVAHTLAVSIATSEYVSSARVVGIRASRLLGRYVLPNAAEPLITVTMLAAANALVVLSALSFLGLGVRPPSYDWGVLLVDGLQRIYTTPVVAFAPAVAIVATGIVFTLAGEALAHAVNPTVRRSSARRREPERRRPRRRLAPADTGRSAHVLAIGDLEVSLGARRDARPVRGVSLGLRPGEVVGLVGESGSGKSMTALAASGLLPPSASADAACLRVAGVDLLAPLEQVQRRQLALRLGMVFQNPTSSLNPARRVGPQVSEVTTEHLGVSRTEARRLAAARLADVGIAGAERRMRQHPHEWSGGMQQRAMIAAALMTEPSVIIADEPTTALDVTVQAQILDLLETLRSTNDAGVLLISHDLAVVAEICDRVLVMYAGEIVEEGPTANVLRAPLHPYTRALIASIPRLDVAPGSPLATIAGQPPPVDAEPEGCPFAPRCGLAVGACAEQHPALEETRPGHRAACLVTAGAEGGEVVGRASDDA